jgi:hypothetical protein
MSSGRPCASSLGTRSAADVARPVTFTKAARAQFRRLLPERSDRAAALERLYHIAEDPERALAEVGAETHVRRAKISGLRFYVLPVDEGEHLAKQLVVVKVLR